MKKFVVCLLVASVVPFSAIAANELDPVSAPKVSLGLILKTNPDGSKEMFKGTLSDDGKANVQKGAEEIAAILDQGDQLPFVSELDRTSSKESWCWGGGYQTVHYYWDYHPVVYYPYYHHGYQYSYPCGPSGMSRCYYYCPMRY